MISIFYSQPIQVDQEFPQIPAKEIFYETSSQVSGHTLYIHQDQAHLRFCAADNPVGLLLGPPSPRRLI